MPEMHFKIRWPNGSEERCYSPSLVLQELLKPEQSYPVYEFMERVGAGLRIAAERVRAKYGFYCSAALEQLSGLQERAKEFDPAAAMTVLALELPASAAAVTAHVAAPQATPGAGTEA